MMRGFGIGWVCIGAVTMAAGCAQQNGGVGRTGAAGGQAGWIELFNGRDMGGWIPRTPADNKWMTASQVTLDPQDNAKFKIIAGSGILVNGREGRTTDICTILAHGDCEAHVEFMVPKGSNSGVYFQGRCEVQILDSFGKKDVEFGDCGGIYARWINDANVEGHARA